MRIANNVPAKMAFNELDRTNKSLAKSIRNLTSGLRINSSADDAAGFAISQRMRTQISGLDTAIQSTQDGISLLQTAEGAISQTNSMLMRMRELAVQASNDSLTSQDREFIQLEIDELRNQINNIANTTQFNKKRILDGSSGAMWSSSDINLKATINKGLISVDEFGQKINHEGNYKIQVEAEPGEGQVQKTNIMTAIAPETRIVTNSSTSQVLFLIDVSGSMSSMIDTVKANIDSFINNIRTQGVENVEIGICTYGNNLTGGIKANEYPDGTLWSGDIDEVKNLLSSSVVASGGDINNYRAVKTASELYGSTFVNNTLSENDVIQSRYMVIVTDVDHKLNPTFYSGAAATESETKSALEGNTQTLEDDIQFSAICPLVDSTSEFYNLCNDSGGIMLNAGSSTWGDDLVGSFASKIAADSTGLEEEELVFPPSPDTKLSNITKFVSPSGDFLLEPPKQITLTQGGRSTTVTLDASDTLKSLTDKLNDAIGNDLGQNKYTSDSKHFASYVSEGVNNSSESVEGTILIRSAIPGKEGEIYFSGDDDLLNALGLNTIQASSESRFTASVYNAHTGQPIAKNVKATDSAFVSLIPPEIDITVDPMAGISADWDDTTKRFIWARKDNYEAMIHLKNNGITFQTGANKGEDFMIDLGDMSSEALDLSGVNVITRESSSRSISIIDKAIKKVSGQRAKIGAYENALENTMNNLRTTSLNITAADSRIRDADMAQEMMKFVKYQILNQSGTSMLAQANQMPSSVQSLFQQ